MADTERRFDWITLLIILALAAFFRIYGLEWDAGMDVNPHPDERYLCMTAARLAVPPLRYWGLFFEPDTGPLNPRRLNPQGEHYDLTYGALPVYIYRITAVALAALTGAPWDSYRGCFMAGRSVTVFFSLATLLLVYLFGRRAYGERVGLLAALLLGLAVIHIHNAHFLTVDTMLTFFYTMTLWASLRLAMNGRFGDALLAGAALGWGMASKASGILALFAPLLAVLIYLLQDRQLLRAIFRLLLIVGGGLVAFALGEPYVLMAPLPYLEAINRQAEMVSGAVDWPYTRQYVNTTPYLYQLEQLFLWELGPALGAASFLGVGAGLAAALYKIRRLATDRAVQGTALLLVALAPYFALVGSYEVKFPRYMLPLAPIFCLLAAWLLGRATNLITTHIPYVGGFVAGLLLISFLLPLLGWAMAMSRIYDDPHPWLSASRWIYEHTEPGSQFTTEIWGDDLPVNISAEGLTRANHNYPPSLRMDVYGDMAPQDKLRRLIAALRQADYVVLSTPRTYRSLRRLPWRYPVENRYYQLLFSGRLGFSLVYIVDVRPGLFGYMISDAAADQSFYDYDHPKVLVYRKVRDLSDEEFRGLFAAELAARPRPNRQGNEPPVDLGEPGQ
jgi:MFS family permease